MLLHVTGLLLLIEAGFMLVPAVTGLCMGESDGRVFGITALVTAAAGFALSRCIRPRSTKMGRREGFLLTASVWVVFSLFGMLPFIFSATPQPLTIAFYEAMSGFTTTGATSVESIGQYSRALTLWCALMQWIGGLGIILFTLAVLPMLNSAGGMQMFNAEVTGITRDKLRPRISQTAIALWKLYGLLTAVCAVLLASGPMDAFEAVCHALGTMSTGGFTTCDTGIDHWDSLYVKVVMIVFMTIGGINFALIYRLLSGGAREVWRNNTLRLFLLLIVCCTAVFAVGSRLQGGVTDAEGLTVDPLFRVVSTITSSGYVTGDAASCGALTCSLMLPLIFFGGCAGSTSGGAKLDRAIVMGKFAANETRRALQPNSILGVKVGTSVLSVEAVQKTLAFLIIYVSIIFIGGMALSAFSVPVADALVASLSAMTNTGYNPATLGLGTTVQAIPQGGLWILSALMLIGRLEVFTVIVLFLPRFWKR